MKFQAKMFSGNALTAIIDGKQYNCSTSHVNWHSLIDAYKTNDADAFVKLFDVVQHVNEVVANSNISGKVKVEDETVYYDGEPLHNTLTTRMITLLRDGHNIDSLVKFLENLMQNPSKTAVDQLYTFLEHKNLGLTEDGCFLAYKSVRNNYLDKYSGTISNKPGTVVEISRNKVDDNNSRECSHGLHVGCLEYSGPNGWYHNQGDQVLIVKVNPKDCVAVPADHNFTKLRCCRYEVVDDFKGELNKAVYTGHGVNHEDYDPEEYRYDEEEEYDNDDDTFDVGDLEEYDSISFFYKGELRYLLVETLNWDDDLVVGKLQFPEQDSGAYRSFKLSLMTDVRLVN